MRRVIADVCFCRLLTASVQQRDSIPGGVDSDSVMTVIVPPGVSSDTFRYSYSSALDVGDDVYVMVNGALLRSYEAGPGAERAVDYVSVSPGDELQFCCRSGGKDETCMVDDLVFNSSRVDGSRETAVRRLSARATEIRAHRDRLAWPSPRSGLQAPVERIPPVCTKSDR